MYIAACATCRLDVLRFLMEQHGLKRKDLKDVFGFVNRNFANREPAGSSFKPSNKGTAHTLPTQIGVTCRHV